MSPTERSRKLGEYLAKLDDAKRAAAELGWAGDMSKIDVLINSTSAAWQREAQRPAPVTLFTMPTEFAVWMAGAL